MENYLFETFFQTNLNESISPFLTKRSKLFANFLNLKISLFCLFILICGWAFNKITPIALPLSTSFIYLALGTPIFIQTIEQLKKRIINIEILMLLAAILTFLMKEYIEGSILLILFSISYAVEKQTILKTQKAIFSLKNQNPTFVRIIRENQTIEKSIQDIAKGDTYIVSPGEMIPLDGIVIEGTSSINFSALTGETKIYNIEKGSKVISGSINLKNPLTIQTEKTYAESTITSIIQLIKSAGSSNSKKEIFFKKLSEKYSYLILALSFIIPLLLYYVFNIPLLHQNGVLYRTIGFLIAASPCALMIATPLAYSSSINALGKKGILLQDSSFLDSFPNLSEICFDKTGTLTENKLKVVKILPLQEETNIEESTIHSYLKSIETLSNHPIGKAICDFTEKAPIKKVEEISIEQGFGISGKIESNFVKVGSYKWLDSTKSLINKIPSKEKIEKFSILQINNNFYLIEFEEAIKKNAKKSIQELIKQHIIINMITGDQKSQADAIAKKLNIENVYAEVSPEEKLRIIKKKISKKSHCNGRRWF